MEKRKFMYYFVLLLLLAACTSTAVVSLVTTRNDQKQQPISPNSNKQETTYEQPTQTAQPAVKESSKDLGKKVKKKTKEKTTNQLSKMSFKAPVMGKVSLEFSNDKPVFSKTLQEWRTHSGVDIQAEIGTAVLAANDGIVEAVKSDPRYGVTIIVDHGSNVKTVYSNLASEVSVTTGQKVKSGTVLGAVGDTAAFESLEATHVHFEILQNNICVDPTKYITTLK